MEAILLVLFIVGIFFYFVLTRTLIIYCFYQWFLMPFFSVPEISFQLAIALALLLSLFHSSNNIKKEYRDNILADAFIFPWFILLIGWLVKIIFL